jgi:extracellular elastinolytic metalloproteinase
LTVLDNTDGNTISNARIFVGHYEARVSPIGDTNPATVGANLNDVADFAPGTYELLAQAPGYGFLRGERTFRRGENSMIEFRMPTNHASITNGATAAGDSNVVSPDQAVAQPGRPAVTPQQVLNMLIDDTERTNWTAAGDITPASPGNLSVAGKQVTVDLAGTKAATIRHIQVSSMLRSGRRTPGADERHSEPLHGAASVRGVGVRRRQGRLQHQRRVRPRVHQPRRRLPGRSAAACGTAHDPA